MQVLASLGCQIAAFLTHIILMNMINILFQFILIISKNLIYPLFSIRLQVSLQMQFLNLGIFTSFFILIFQYIVTHNKILGVLQFFIVVEQLLKQNSMINLTSKQLQEYTKDQNHHGINKMDILLKFIEYIGQCQDPQNIFRFMEEKAICTFLSQYWLFKADYYVQIGQFRMAFQYLQQAQSRNGIGQDDKEKFVDINSKYKKIFNVLVNDIKNFPLKSKRSIEEYDLISNEKKNSNQKQKKQKLLQLYQNKYSGLKKQKQQASQLKRKHFGKSWLYEIYEKQDSKELKIEEMVMENSNRLSKDYRNHTMHTPIRYRDPQRLTKTMDSVEILKKKKSTNEKSRKNGKINKDHDVSDSELLDEDWNIQDSSSKMITSVPVGRKFTQLKQRRVTFDMSGKSLMLQQKQKRQNSLSFCDKSASNSILSKNNLLKNKKKKIETSEIKDKQTLSQVSQNPKSSKGVKFQPKK